MPRRSERLVVAFGALLLLAHAMLYLEAFEDSFITYRYARNLAIGQGLVYNPGERVEGFTSFGWTLLLAVLTKLGIGAPTIAPALSLGLGVVFVVLAARRSPSIALLAATSPSLAYYAATGMETTAFLALFMGGIVLTLAPDTRRHAFGGVLLAVAAMFRPEGLGYAFAIVATLATFDRRRAIVTGGAFGALFVPWFLWRMSYFGYPFPNTYYAKASPSFERFRAGAAHLEAFVTLHGWWLVLPAIGLVAKRRGLDPWSRVGAAVILATAVNVVLVGGDGFVFWRFLLPALPFALGFVVDAVKLLIERRQAAWVGAGLFGALQIGAAFFPQYTLLEHDGRSAWSRTRGVAAINKDYFDVGHFLAATFPPRTAMAVNAAGIVPYESGLVTIDMLGLNDVHIAHRAMPKWEGAIGHQKHDAQYVLSRGPDLILPGLPVLAKRPPRPEEVAPYFAKWFPFLPGDRELLESPEFQRRYGVAVAQVADGKFLIFYQRRDAFLDSETH